MHRAKAILILLAVCHAPGADFSGVKALQATAEAVALGPRPPGSPAHRKLQAIIRNRLQAAGCKVIEDRFTASTPIGAVPMNNIVCQLAGSSGQIIVLSGHYDTKRLPAIPFVGANDAGSSTGFLLEMARVLSSTPRRDDIYLALFDGEEAFGPWSDTDGVYGSRHLAEQWARDGTLRRIKALINVDMIGDKDLGILEEMNSSPALRRFIWRVAGQLGLGRHFLPLQGWIEDDHIPFLRRGVNAVNLIDFDFGPGNSWWHTPADTMDKLSPHSLEAVGRVVQHVLRRLDEAAGLPENRLH